MKSRFSTLVLFVVAASAIVWSAWSTATAAAAPVSLEDATVEVQLWPEGEPGVSVVIAAVRLPESVQLPATVRIPVPPDAVVTWAGEISGGGVESDIQRTHKIVETEFGQAVEFTVEQTRTVQYDATYRVMDVSGDRYSVTMDWVQSVPSKDVAFGILVPAGVDEVEVSPDPPGTPARNMLGESLYSLTPLQLAPGESTSVSVSYRKLVGATSTGSTEFPLLPVLLAVFAVAVAALIFAVLRSNASRVRLDADDHDTPADEDAE